MASLPPIVRAVLDDLLRTYRDEYQMPIAYRIHPEDYATLRREMTVGVVGFVGFDGKTMCGVTLVVDRNAPRITLKSEGNDGA